MAIDMEAVLQQKRELSEISGDIVSLRRSLATYEDDISSAWQGREVAGVTAGIDAVIRLLNSISEELDDIGRDMVSEAQEIQAEEKRKAEEKARAEEEARRAEKARLEKEAQERREREEAAAREKALAEKAAIESENEKTARIVKKLKEGKALTNEEKAFAISKKNEIKASLPSIFRFWF